jgi:HSP20 family molecular chaperone IbpA
MSAPTRKQQIENERVTLKLCSPEELLNLKQELHDRIARRAYELFEKRERQPEHEVDDWVQAESEILHGCRHEIVEHLDSFVLRADLPGEHFTTDQIKVSIEPRRVMVSGKQQISALYLEGDTTQTKPLIRTIFRVHELPADVDPGRSKATLSGERFEIVMPKLSKISKEAKHKSAAS